MKKIIIAVAMITFLVVAGSGWAYQITINKYAGYYLGSGGEFNITGLPGTDSLGYASSALLYGGFETFCLEYSEIVSMGSSYYAEISSSNSTTKDNDAISQGTAYLYSLFAQGQLSGYNYNNVTTNYSDPTGRYASAAALQNTIWWLEGEISVKPTNNSFLSLVENKFGTTGAYNAYTNYNPSQFNYGVGVLNLYTSAALKGTSQGKAQDQLFYASVPEPATMLLLGLGLIGLASVRRKCKA